MQHAVPSRSPVDQAFQRMARLASRDPFVRALVVSLVQASALPPDDRDAILRQFLSAGTQPDGSA
jgi:hypothetical protein